TVQPSGAQSKGGSWAALDPVTGRILWQTAVPDGSDGLGPPTVANGVVYVGSMARTGNQMYALDAGTGAILWQCAARGAGTAGAAHGVGGGCVGVGGGHALNLTCGYGRRTLSRVIARERRPGRRRRPPRLLPRGRVGRAG